MSRATGYGFLVVLLLGAALLGRCSDECAAGPAAGLIRYSTFAHGYLHGYQAGFHAGDADFHVARVRSLRELRWTDRTAGYRRDFGPRATFRDGFRQGFVVGYQDSVAGRDFRGFRLLAASTVADAVRPRDFDHGFEDGYKTGQKRGTGDLDADADFDPELRSCPARPGRDGRLPASSQAYCAGYRSAYRLGYSDGYLLASPAGEDTELAAR